MSPIVAAAAFEQKCSLLHARNRAVVWEFWNPDMKRGAATLNDRSDVSRTAHLSFFVSTKTALIQVASTLRPFAFLNLVSYFSVLIVGESSILVDAPGESMRVYSLLQRRRWKSGSLEAIQQQSHSQHSPITTAWPLHSFLSISIVPPLMLVCWCWAQECLSGQSP